MFRDALESVELLPDRAHKNGLGCRHPANFHGDLVAQSGEGCLVRDIVTHVNSQSIFRKFVQQ